MKTTIKIESDKPVVVIPLDDYEGMIETIEILSENPKILGELKKEKKEFLKGNFVIYKRDSEKSRRPALKAKKVKQ